MNPLLPTTPFVIGHTPDGQPVWLDPADLQPTADQQAARSESARRGVLEGTTRDLARQVLAHREEWLHTRIMAIAPVEVGTAMTDFMRGAAASRSWQARNRDYLEARLRVVVEWLKASGIHCQEPPYDGVAHRVLLKRGTDTLSEWLWKPVPVAADLRSPDDTTPPTQCHCG